MLGRVGLKRSESRDVFSYVITHQNLLFTTETTAPPAQTLEVAAETRVTSSHKVLMQVVDTPREWGATPYSVLISRAGGRNEELGGSEAKVGDPPPRWAHAGGEAPTEGVEM